MHGSGETDLEETFPELHVRAIPAAWSAHLGVTRSLRLPAWTQQALGAGKNRPLLRVLLVALDSVCRALTALPLPGA